MDLQNISLDPIRKQVVGVLGYGNQGRAQALNLRDSGVKVLVGGRKGEGLSKAVEDGFSVRCPGEVAKIADVLMFLFPDSVIGSIYANVSAELQARPRVIGFAHGFSYHYGLVEPIPGCHYFLVGPKGAGALLRERYVDGRGLPGVFAIDHGSDATLRVLTQSYAKAIGIRNCLLETTFAEETECDLFGEQAVLCGGIPDLMEAAFNVLVDAGHSPEMAFFETCYEARMILEMWMKAGPSALRDKISPTAFYGGSSRGRRLITDDTRKELKKIFDEVRSGSFAKEWLAEVANGAPSLNKACSELKTSALELTYQKLKSQLGE